MGVYEPNETIAFENEKSEVTDILARAMMNPIGKKYW